jgi:iron complex transport system substrate-binding protein
VNCGSTETTVKEASKMKRPFPILFTVISFWSVALAAPPSVEVVEETSEYRVVSYEGETYRVPVNPERIVVLGYRAPDNLLALRLQPVGMGAEEGGAFPPHLAAQVANVTPVGSWYEPSLEAILTLEPDLIIGEVESHGALRGQLEAITPNVLLVPEYNPSGAGGAEGARESLTILADALGMTERAEGVLSEHERELARARGLLREAVGDETVAVIRARDREYDLVGVRDGYIGPVLYGDLGLTPPAFVAGLDERAESGNVALSLEVLPEIQAEHLFVISSDDASERELLDYPLWDTLPAVQVGNVYWVSPRHWLSTTVLADGAKVHDVLGALAGEAP